eukprot:scaffold192116_cov18-Tisochrysis_lutea.AAC.3
MIKGGRSRSGHAFSYELALHVSNPYQTRVFASSLYTLITSSECRNTETDPDQPAAATTFNPNTNTYFSLHLCPPQNYSNKNTVPGTETGPGPSKAPLYFPRPVRFPKSPHPL